MNDILCFCYYSHNYTENFLFNKLTVITPSLIVFLFRITIPIGFRINFFGMAADQQRKRLNLRDLLVFFFLFLNF